MNRRTAVTMLITPSAGLLAGLAVGKVTGIHAQAKQKTGQGRDDTFTLRSDVRLVLLDVSVKDRKGGFANDLKKTNFTVEENGRIQPITVFSHEDAPVTVGILVDESRSMAPKHAEVIAAANVFVEECNRQDEIFVVHFNDQVTFGLPPKILFSDNIKQLHDALTHGSPDGKTALYDAVIAGLAQLEMGRRTKKALVLISDGGDTSSDHGKREMIDLIEKSAGTIYAIGLFEEDDPDRAPGLLRQLAGMSGGMAFFPHTAEDMIPICRQIASEIRSRYTVGYVPAPGNDSVRHVRVHVSAPGRDGFNVRTRTGYRYSTGPV